MTRENLQVLESFTVANLPDLDVVVLGALELFTEVALPAIQVDQFDHIMVLGSGNAAYTGRIVFNRPNVVLADESSFHTEINRQSVINAAYLLSASGGKHAIEMSRLLREKGIHTFLLTNNPGAPSRAYLDDNHVLVFPKNREPYTYNTSTYLGMILARTGEFVPDIHTHLLEMVKPMIPQNLTEYDAFTFIIPARFAHLKGMIVTKFDELFGPMVVGRVFTEEEIKHAKTVVQSGSECFLSLGVRNDHYGRPANRISIPMPESYEYGAMMSIAYFVVGQIQRQKPSYFKQNIDRYIREASEIFGYNITAVVE